MLSDTKLDILEKSAKVTVTLFMKDIRKLINFIIKPLLCCRNTTFLHCILQKKVDFSDDGLQTVLCSNVQEYNVEKGSYISLAIRIHRP